MNYSLSEIANVIDGRYVNDNDEIISYISTDTRKITNPQNTIFFALVTSSSDGHKYLEHAISQNVGGVVVSEFQDNCPLPQIVVKNSLVALQKLAKHHRSRFNIPIIAVTGSNGKTIVKEWAARLLNSSFNVCKNPKSYNSQIGVPLSTWNLNENHSIGIFEAGISQPKEMHLLADILQPTIGVFTHLGDAHLANFKSTQELIDEKVRLFNTCEVVVAHSSNSEVIDLLESKNSTLFKIGSDATCEMQTRIEGSEIILSYRSKTFKVKPPSMDNASIENCLSAVAIALINGVSTDSIEEQVKLLKPIDMRLQQVDGVYNTELILDFYNSDLESIKIALDFLKQQENKTNHIVILSDVQQSGIPDSELYQKVNDLLKQHEVNHLVTVGPKLKAHQHLFTISNTNFESTEELISSFPFQSLENSTVLLKAARNFEFELVADHLRFKNHQTALEVNLTRITENLNTIRGKLNSSTKMMAMVKALSYGSGGFQIAKLLEFNNVDFLGVAYLDEAVELRKAGISVPIMVLNPDLSNLDSYRQNDIQPVIYSFESIEQVVNENIKIHIELDTGMHRLGFLKHEISSLCERLSNANCEVISVFSHLAVADQPEMDHFTQNQITDYENAVNQIELALGKKVIKHISNTAGIERFKNAQFNMVRLGIGLYGISNLKASKLKPVSTFKSFIAQIKPVPKGEGIGYGQHDKSPSDRNIAIIAVGYADGYNRGFSQGKGYFIINGEKAPVVGNICMDMTMCDVTGIDCKAGDEVLIFGDNPSVETLAKQLNTIPYEILTNVSERVSRIFYQE